LGCGSRRSTWRPASLPSEPRSTAPRGAPPLQMWLALPRAVAALGAAGLTRAGAALGRLALSSRGLLSLCASVLCTLRSFSSLVGASATPRGRPESGRRAVDRDDPSPLAVVVGLIVSARRAKELGGADTHGSARWATRVDLEAPDSSAETRRSTSGVERRAHRPLLRHDGPQHVWRSPRSIRQGRRPRPATLLSWPGSVSSTTSRRELGADRGLAPAGTAERVPEVRPDAADAPALATTPSRGSALPDDVKDAQSIADLLIDPAGTGGHDHWTCTGT